jgi:hypothetical protein
MSIGQGYHFSEMSRRVSTASGSNIITKLASRSITGHYLPLQVHQHYGLEVHLDFESTKHGVSTDNCINKLFLVYTEAPKFCAQLETSSLQGLYFCVFDDSRVLSMTDKDEQWFRADPLPSYFIPLWEDEDFIPRQEDGDYAEVRRLNKAYQDCLGKSYGSCCCRGTYEVIGR